MASKQSLFYKTYVPQLAVLKNVIQDVQLKYNINYNILIICTLIYEWTIDMDPLFVRANIKPLVKYSSKRIDIAFMVMNSLGFIELVKTNNKSKFYKKTSKIDELVRFYSQSYSRHLKRYALAKSIDRRCSGPKRSKKYNYKSYYKYISGFDY